jgi:death-on-curing protein
MNSNSAKRIRYLTASELYHINDTVTDGHAFVRDVHLLNSAVKRPSIVLFGQPQFPSLVDKAAALLHSLAYHHLFADGNKRTAALALEQFLTLNGCALTWDASTQAAFILEVAQGKYEADEVAARLAEWVRER